MCVAGEWFHQPNEPLVQIGGHAINIVGYNDHFRTVRGFDGGWIVRNTWEDGMGRSHGMRARGSHSAAYFLQDVGELDESYVCPNPHSPRSWMTCGSVAECTSPMTLMSAESTRKVFHLKCVDDGSSLPTGACEPGEGYYFQNITDFGSAGLYVACFLRVQGTEATSKCYPPMPFDDLPMIFGPTDEEIKRVGINDPEVCGFNFIPYETYETLQSRFGDVIATSYGIELDRSPGPELPRMRVLTTAPHRSFTGSTSSGLSAHTHRAASTGMITLSSRSRRNHSTIVPVCLIRYDYTLIEESTKPLKTVPEYAPSRYDPNGL